MRVWCSEDGTWGDLDSLWIVEIPDDEFMRDAIWDSVSDSERVEFARENGWATNGSRA